MSDEPRSWPQYVGRDATEVQEILIQEGFEPVILSQGSPMTLDYRLERVRLFVDDNNTIVQPPTTG